MGLSQHPNNKEIAEYVRETLPDEKHIKIGEHLFICKKCMEKTRAEYKNNIVMENWSARNIGELLWRMKILTELKNNTISSEESIDTRGEERLAAESPPGEQQTIIKHYYSKDKKIIVTVEYSASSIVAAFETRDPDISDSIIIFAFVSLNSRKVIVCDKVRLDIISPGIWEKRWQGTIPFSPDLTLLFTY